jgi:hypothetical protein
LDSGIAGFLLGKMAGKPDSLEAGMLGPAKIVILFCLQACQPASLYPFCIHQQPITFYLLFNSLGR